MFEPALTNILTNTSILRNEVRIFFLDKKWLLKRLNIDIDNTNIAELVKLAQLVNGIREENKGNTGDYHNSPNI